MTVAAEVRTAPFYSGGVPRVHLWGEWTITSGAAAASALNDSDLTLGDFTDGVAAIGYPGSPRALVRVHLVPAAITNDTAVQITAKNAGAGTATVTAHDNGTAENPADGSIVIVEVVLDKRAR